jgi:hypothetical protein
MRNKYFLYVALSLLLSSGIAFAQSSGDIRSIFGGLMQSVIVQTTRVQWQKLPSKEIACVNQMPQTDESTMLLVSRHLPCRALPVAEFVNNVLPGNRVKCPGIHVVVGKHKAAKPRIVMAGHPLVSRRINRCARA